MSDDPIANLLKKTKSLKHIYRKGDDEPENTNISTKNYEPQFYPELSKDFDFAVAQLIKLKGMPKLLCGPAGIGKTSSVYRQGKKNGYLVKKFDSSKDYSSEATKEILFNLITTKHITPIIILIDDLEHNIIPKWFAPKKEKQADGTEKVKKNRDTFLELAVANSRAGNFLLVATTNNDWKLPEPIRAMFDIVKNNGPWRKALKQAAKQFSSDIKLGNEFPRDIRQLHLYLKYGGRRADPKVVINQFAAFKDFFLSKPRLEIPDLRPKIELWILANMLNMEGQSFVEKNQLDFYKVISLLAHADFYKNRDFLLSLPYFGSVSYIKINHPTTFRKMLKESAENGAMF